MRRRPQHRAWRRAGVRSLRARAGCPRRPPRGSSWLHLARLCLLFDRWTGEWMGRHASLHPAALWCVRDCPDAAGAATLSSQKRQEDDMSMPDPGLQATSAAGRASRPAPEPLRGANWVLFAGIMLMLMAILNVIWGIAAIDNSSFFVNDTDYILSSLNTWGWVALGIAALQAIAAFSI